MRISPGKDFCLPFSFSVGQPRENMVNVRDILRILVLLIASAVMVLGGLIMTGLFVPPNLPENFRLIGGAVVFLYGAYRFAVTFYRKRDSDE